MRVKDIIVVNLVRHLVICNDPPPKVLIDCIERSK